MRRRGRALSHARPRRRRQIWLLAIPLILAGTSVYFLFFKTPQAHIAWQHTFMIPMSHVRLELLPEGGTLVLGDQCIEALDGQGNPATQPFPVNDRGYILGLGKLTDSQRKVYAAYEDQFVFFNTAGTPEWSIKLPDNHISAGSYRNLYTSVISDDLVVVADSHGNFTRIGTNVELIGTHIESAYVAPMFCSCPVQISGRRYSVFAHDPAAALTQCFLTTLDETGKLLEEHTVPFRFPDEVIGFGDKLLCRGGGVFMVDVEGEVLWQYVNQDPITVPGWDHHYQVETCGETIFIASEQHLMACTVDGKLLWELTLADVQGIAAESVDVQYVIDSTTSDIVYLNWRKLNQWLSKRNPKLAGKMSYPDSSCELARIEHGRVTRRWVLPDNIFDIAGPDEAGRLYLFSTFSNTMYCVEP